MSSGPLTPRALGEEGLREAFDRLKTRLSGPDAGDPLISLGEFLTWLFALKEHHKGKLTPEENATSASTDEQTFYALIFARNRIQHDLDRTSELVEQLIPAGPYQAIHSQSRVVGMVPVGGYQWKARTDLTETTRSRELKPLYDAHVAGKPLLEPIEVGMQFILGLP